MTAWEWPNSTAVRIIDGDTLIALVHRELGFNGKASFTQRLRLNRIDAWRLSSIDPRGSQARAFTHAATLDALMHVRTVRAYKYGDEWMAEIILPSGENLSDALVAAGHAAYWNGQGPAPSAA